MSRPGRKSLLWLALRLARAGLALRRKLAGAIGPGPLGSTVVPDERVVVAVTSVGRGRLVVSDRALGELDRGELWFHVERDADQYTVRPLRDPLALASAICKAAGAPGAGLAGLGGGGRVTQRLEDLLEASVPVDRRNERAAWAMAAGLLAVLATLGLSAPAWSPGTGQHAATEGHHACSQTA